MSTDCKYISGNSPTSVGKFFLPEKAAWIHEYVGCHIPSIENDLVDGESTVVVNTTNITDKNKDGSIMSEIPKISSQFCAKLNIEKEIKDLLSIDENFNYVLHSILKILDSIFDDYENLHHVEVKLESDEDNPKWKHADIKIKLDDDSLISEIWRAASKSVKEFYKAVDERKIMPSGTLNRIHKFIYIIVD